MTQPVPVAPQHATARSKRRSAGGSRAHTVLRRRFPSDAACNRLSSGLGTRAAPGQVDRPLLAALDTGARTCPVRTCNESR